MSDFNPTAYKNDFTKQKYDRVSVVLPKGDKERIKAHADRFDGGSINALIKRAIDMVIESDLTE